jgi:hypothetical protein
MQHEEEFVANKLTVQQYINMVLDFVHKKSCVFNISFTTGDVCKYMYKRTKGFDGFDEMLARKVAKRTLEILRNSYYISQCGERFKPVRSVMYVDFLTADVVFPEKGFDNKQIVQTLKNINVSQDGFNL